MAKDQPKQPAQVDTTVRMVPPLKCRWQTPTGEQRGCGRGMQPRVDRWRQSKSSGKEYACCRCGLCGSAFVYYPAPAGGVAMVRGILDPVA